MNIATTLFVSLEATICLAQPWQATEASDGSVVLRRETFQHYIGDFNANDEEVYAGAIPNAKAWAFLSDNIPLFDCADKSLEEIYYFRWWTYRKHLKPTPDGFIITEFLPEVNWAGKYNSINCAAALHIYEGRWLHDSKYLNDYARFWLRKGGGLRVYSFWIADALWNRFLVTGDPTELKEFLPDLISNYREWERTHQDPNGLFWQSDDRDGMEMSVGGSGYRPTINSYMFAEAQAIAKIATLCGDSKVAAEFQSKASKLKQLVQQKLWNPDQQFFETLPNEPSGVALAGVREEAGYSPWYVNLPDTGYETAWAQLTDTNGFSAAFGPTTTERRCPKFALSYQGHECQWNGPSWPYSTAITLTAMANLLNNYQQQLVTKRDYLDLLQCYTKSQHLRREDGRVTPWIDENLNPFNGDWMARTILKTQSGRIYERGKDYNHSTFCDLIVTGLVGLRPQPDDKVEVNPLVPEGALDYFCLDNVAYHGHTLTILYDKTGERYQRGKGLLVLADGNAIGSAGALTRIAARLPASSPAETTGGWIKYSGSPVIGGKYGTCFDISVMKETETYRMWLSWRPKQSVALVESKDGIHWSEPPKIVLGPRSETGWEDDINRPVVIRHANRYHVWYTGQAAGHSWIGYATSPDGVQWQRMSTKPVLSFDRPWEKVAVMCPDVIWDDELKRFRMWYSGGEQNEPNAIGYATSPDGLVWTKHASNPVFKPDPASSWDQFKVTGDQVVKHGDWYYMFYIGFRDEEHAQIGLARSRDGITQWQRLPSNPIVRPGKDKWDHDACYKPYAIFDGQKWLLWYNGRHGGLEQIGVAIHEGEDLGFDK